jgi:hypothetical protein
MFANAVLMPVARVFIPTVAANAISATTGVLDQILAIIVQQNLDFSADAPS